MSRIPNADWLPLADQAKSVESFPDKAELVGPGMSKPAATLIALHYEAVAVITTARVLAMQ